jgi:hypothetical protein
MDDESDNPAQRRERVQPHILEFIRDNPDANEAFRAMIERGVEHEHAESEIAKVLLACLAKMWSGARIDRLTSSLKALRDGRTATELFPEDAESDSSGP